MKWLQSVISNDILPLAAGQGLYSSFLTPVLFSVSILDDRPQQLFLLYLNPMTAVIVGYQRALLDGLPPQWDALAYSTVVAVVLFIAGFWYFDRAKDDFESAL